jgi:rubredoxin
MKRNIRILATGGLISPADLKLIATVAGKYDCTDLQFGTRQEIYLQAEESKTAVIVKELSSLSYICEDNFSGLQNVVTSYAAVDVYPTLAWAVADVYMDTLEEFDYKPQLKISISDPVQGLIPMFTGNLNFIASHHVNYWYLFLDIPGCFSRAIWPSLIETDDIANYSRYIEQVLASDSSLSVNGLFEEVNNKFRSNSRFIDKDFVMPRGRLPYYEGLNKVNDYYVLGIYRRNYNFPVAFIEELCDLCTESKIAKISITPWKSVVVKNIQDSDRIKWEMLLGKYGINIRHSSLELHWQLPDLDENALKLKNRIVRSFDDKDIRTYGLSFALKTQPLDIFTNVVIEPAGADDKFNVFHTTDFNTNSNSFVEYQKGVDIEELDEVLQQLCLKYFAQLNKPREQAKSNADQRLVSLSLFQCPECQTIYNEQVGDIMKGIQPGVSFADLPADYCCPVCDESKEHFILKNPA